VTVYLYMKEQFVPYGVAKDLKSKGYNEPCFAVYGYNMSEYESDSARERLVQIQEISLTEESNLEFEDLRNSNIGEDISAPLLQEAIDWFEAKGIMIEVKIDQTTYPKYCFFITKYIDPWGWEPHQPSEWFLYLSRREATVEAIKEAAKLI
jgi:hypothetical protein